MSLFATRTGSRVARRSPEKQPADDRHGDQRDAEQHAAVHPSGVTKRVQRRGAALVAMTFSCLPADPQKPLGRGIRQTEVADDNSVNGDNLSTM